MSALTAPAHILVTGGSGFIGSAVLANLLSKGFSVRTVVRSNAKAAPIQKTFASYISSGKFQCVVIPDMTVPGAFTEVLKGIDGVVHVASPMPPMDPKTDPESMTGPAVKMTMGIMEGAAKVPSVKRVVVTSSVITLYEPKEGKYVYSEADWFDTAPKLVKQYGVEASGGVKYIASKVLAERAAWRFVEQNKPSYELVTVLPPWIWGKSVLSDPHHFRAESSNNHILATLARAKSGEMDAEDLLSRTRFADVLDISEGHVRALTTPEAAGQRFTFRCGSITWQDVLDILNAKPIAGLTLPSGRPGSGKSVEINEPYSAAKSKKVLGMTYRPIADTIHDLVEQAVELGWSVDAADAGMSPAW